MFLGALGGLGAGAIGSAADEKKTRFYLMEQMFLRNGGRLPQLHDFMSKVVLPALSRLHSGPKIYLEAVVAPHVPQFAAIYGFESLQQIEELHRKIHEDKELLHQIDQFESGPETTLQDQTNTVLEAASYSPEIPLSEPGAAPRLFELRTYHSPTWHQLRALHERFAGPEIKIFHRSGVHPVLYSSTIFGAQMPNLTYLIPFESLAAREKAWATFGADPEWIKVRDESIQRSGQIAGPIQVSIFKATPYSPVK